MLGDETLGGLKCSSATARRASPKIAGSGSPRGQPRAMVVVSSSRSRVASRSLRSPAGPKAWICSPSVSSTAMSTASSEVPVMNPRIRMVWLTAMARAG
jgi:hypothetical protein